MIKRVNGCDALYNRIKDSKDAIGLRSFIRTPTDQAKVEQLPLCFMNYGIDSIIKKSSRTASVSRPGMYNTCAVEVVFEIVSFVDSDIVSIFRNLRKAILDDIHPLLDSQGEVDKSVYITEERKEGPFGYGIPDVVAFVFVISLIYPDEL